MKTWTKEQEDFLIANGDKMTVKELMVALNKTNGAIRNKKSALKIKNNRCPLFTQEEKDIIKEWYVSHLESDEGGIELEKLAEKLKRPKTSISAIAREMGLTKYGNFSKEERQNRATKMSYVVNNYEPTRFFGKHHTLESRHQMSIKQIIRFENMSDEEKSIRANKSIITKRNNNIYTITSNAYSRCKGGFREDLQQYFRSSWEANIARYLDYLNIKWEFEPKRFNFLEINSGVLSYMPDFYLPELDKWIEVKGWMDDKSKIRLQYFKQFYPEESIKLILIDRKKYNLIEKQYKFLINNWEFPNQTNNEVVV
jgi:hypothetical protein